MGCGRWRLAAAACLLPTWALGQSPGGFVAGQTLTAAELNAALSAKQDYPLGDVSSGAVTATGSVLARPLSTRFAEVVNAKDYGVLCDGTTDDRSAIASAISVAASGNVKAVYFPPSATACMMCSKVALANNLTLVGYPGTVTLKACNTNGSVPVLLDAEAGNLHDILVYGLTLDGNVAGQKGTGGASNIGRIAGAFSANRVVYDHVKFQNTYGQAIQFQGSTNSGVRHSVFDQVGNWWHTSGLQTDARQGISFIAATENNFYGNFADDNAFTNLGLDALNVSNQRNIAIRNNRCMLGNQQWFGAGVGAACVFVFGSRGVLITGNVAYQASGASYDVPGNEVMTLTGNSSYNAGLYGINIGNGGLYGVTTGENRVTISGNSFVNGGQNSSVTSAGINISKASSTATAITQIIIEGNVVADDQGSPTQKYGISRQDTGNGLAAMTGVTIGRNQVSGNITAPIFGLAPAISACGGGSPALDTAATDSTGTLTEGTTATGCVLTFAAPFNQTPHCIVTGAALTSYSVSTTALTLVNPSASGGIYTYRCEA